MKTILLLLGFSVMAVAPPLCEDLTAQASQPGGDTNAAAQVGAVIDAYLDASNRRDTAALAELYVEDERFFWIEDGAVRYRTAAEAIASLASLPESMAFTTTFSDRTILLTGTNAAHVSVAFTTRMGPAAGGFSFSGAITMTLERISGEWRILAGHTSTPAPDSGGEGL